MANEITVSGSITGYKSTAWTAAVFRSFAALSFTMSASFYVEGVLSVLTTATVIPLGAVTTPHWAFFYNKDATNFVRLMNGASGAKVVKLLAGAPAIFPWDDAATPYAIADTAACLVEYLIFGK